MGIIDSAMESIEKAAPAAAVQAEAVEAAYSAADKGTPLKRAKAFGVRTMGYAAIGSAGLAANTGVAFAQANVDITNLNSILTFIGKVIIVVGIALAGWNLVQVGMSMKDNQGFQMDKNVWGIVGGIAMTVAGGAFNSAANQWG